MVGVACALAVLGTGGLGASGMVLTGVWCGVVWHVV